MRVELVHGYLTQFGGAKRVLMALLELFLGAFILCSIAHPGLLP